MHFEKYNFATVKHKIPLGCRNVTSGIFKMSKMQLCQLKVMKQSFLHNKTITYTRYGQIHNKTIVIV